MGRMDGDDVTWWFAHPYQAHIISTFHTHGNLDITIYGKEPVIHTVPSSLAEDLEPSHFPLILV